MKIKQLKLINNVLFYGSVIFAIGVLGKSYWDRSRLPEGVCPINNNSHLIYASIGLLIVSFAFSIILSQLEKRNKTEEITESKDMDKDESDVSQ